MWRAGRRGPLSPRSVSKTPPRFFLPLCTEGTKSDPLKEEYAGSSGREKLPGPAVSGQESCGELWAQVGEGQRGQRHQLEMQWAKARQAVSRRNQADPPRPETPGQPKRSAYCGHIFHTQIQMLKSSWPLRCADLQSVQTRQCGNPWACARKDPQAREHLGQVTGTTGSCGPTAKQGGRSSSEALRAGPGVWAGYPGCRSAISSRACMVTTSMRHQWPCAVRSTSSGVRLSAEEKAGSAGARARRAAQRAGRAGAAVAETPAGECSERKGQRLSPRVGRQQAGVARSQSPDVRSRKPTASHGYALSVARLSAALDSRKVSRKPMAWHGPDAT